MPPMPSELTAARRGSLPAGQGRHCVLTKNGVSAKSDRRIRAAEMEARRQRLVLQGQRRLDEPGHAGGRFQVADVRFHRADRAELLVAASRGGRPAVRPKISTGSPIAVAVPWASR